MFDLDRWIGCRCTNKYGLKIASCDAWPSQKRVISYRRFGSWRSMSVLIRIPCKSLSRAGATWTDRFRCGRGSFIAADNVLKEQLREASAGELREAIRIACAAGHRRRIFFRLSETSAQGLIIVKTEHVTKHFGDVVALNTLNCKSRKDQFMG